MFLSIKQRVDFKQPLCLVIVQVFVKDEFLCLNIPLLSLQPYTYVAVKFYTIYRTRERVFHLEFKVYFYIYKHLIVLLVVRKQLEMPLT